MNPKLRLVLLSSLLLFVELALIRWTSSNLVYLSYFSNFVLLGSFLGIGVGFLRGSGREDLFRWSPTALALLVGFVLVFPVEIDRSGSSLVFFGDLRATGLPPWLVLPVVFVLVAAVMATIAQGVARVFAQFPPLEAYRWDIVGSIAGIAAFSVLSFLHAPPVAWGLITAALFALVSRSRLGVLQYGSLAALVALLLVESLAAPSTWSPYYKIDVSSDDSLGYTRHVVDVNGVPHQEIDSVAHRRFFEQIYFLPYERMTASRLGDVLVVGAGNGSDVAIALDAGADHVDAIEIDPRLQEIGEELHPDQPYDDERVDVHIEDGRAFLERTEKRYQLILFALPDSITLVAGQSSLRLESYLFTEEAIEAARRRLADGGVFAMYNFYREDWLIDRLAGTLRDVFGRAPCVDSVGDEGRLALLMASDDASAVDCEVRWTPGRAVPEPATDDHPFLYLRDRTIPGFYLVTIGLILLASLLLVRGAAGSVATMSNYLDLFFMGVAFLLLETKNVVQFALLFGTTWFVNALVFGGILLSVVVAIEVARRTELRRPQLLYAALFGALAVAFAVPQSALLDLDAVPRFAAATLLAFTPIFFANLVFARRFRDVESSTTAFAANLLGAMVGGVLEYLALITGYRALLLVVAAAYALAFVAGRRHLGRRVAPPPVLLPYASPPTSSATTYTR